jgi:hypothetical protein
MAKELTAKQKASRLMVAVRRGESAKAYSDRVGWDYKSLRYELLKAGFWHRVMAAKYDREVTR